MSRYQFVQVLFVIRFRYTFGEAAMRRLRGAQVLISGIGGVGVEVAKNLILSGVRHVTVHDTKVASYSDLSAQVRRLDNTCA